MLVFGVALTSAWSYVVLSGATVTLEIPLLPWVIKNGLILKIDRLSAFFIAVVNFTVFTGFLYARGYLRPYYSTKNSLRFSIHYFAYLWLYLSMIMVG
jgi:formate hydrogenlyase subunit 3/multisubunit Na+/H+ antiporter MnhD subunit